MLLIKSNNVIVVLILFSFLRSLLQATVLNTIQSELFRLKIEKKKGKQPQCSTSIYDYSYNNIVNDLNAPHIVEELWSTNLRQSPNFQSNAVS